MILTALLKFDIHKKLWLNAFEPVVGKYSEIFKVNLCAQIEVRPVAPIWCCAILTQSCNCKSACDIYCAAAQLSYRTYYSRPS